MTENLILQRLHYSFHDQIAFTTDFHIACCIPQKQHGIHNNHVQWHLKSVNGKAETIMCYYHYYYYIILLLLNNGHAPKLINIILLCYGSEAAELFKHYHQYIYCAKQFKAIVKKINLPTFHIHNTTTNVIARTDRGNTDCISTSANE